MKKQRQVYLYLGGGAVIENTRLIGVFDLDNTSWSHLTRRYLSQAEQAGLVENVAEDIPRSFAVCADGTVILTQPSTATLVRRLENQERTNV